MIPRKAILIAAAVLPFSGVAFAFDTDAFQRNERSFFCRLPMMDLFCVEPRMAMWPAVEEALTPGMSQQDVVSLLGPADFSDNTTLSYFMGRSGIDADYLVIRFEHGRLKATVHARE